MVYQQLPLKGQESPYSAEFIRNIVDEILNDLESKLVQRSIRISSDLEEGNVRVPYHLFRNSISFLFEDSIDRMPSGGEIFITVTHFQQCELVIADTAAGQDPILDPVAIRVQSELIDYGVGVDTMQRPEGGTTRILAFPLR